MIRLLTCLSLLVLLVRAHAGAQEAAPAEPSMADRPVQSWLYVEPHEVRHEILLPLQRLETVMPVPRRDPARLTVEEQDAARRDIADVVASLCPVEIDGLRVQPHAWRVVYFDRAIASIIEDPAPAPVAVDRTAVGLILRYASKTPPHTVTLRWQAFNPVLDQVQHTTLRQDEAARRILTATAPSVTWVRAPGDEIPPVRRVDAPARGTLDAATARLIMETLLANVYRAFDHREEGAIYDALAESATGDLLVHLYLDIRRSLELEAEGGATARVHEVRVVDGELLVGSENRQPFRYRVAWEASGRVEHWGHVHDRTNAYAATFRVDAVDGAWRLTEMSIERHERLDTGLKVRALPEAAP